MRLLVLSDLHREIWYRSGTNYEGKDAGGELAEAP